MLVELLGPSGVGKSTVLQSAQLLRSEQPEWIGPSETITLLGASSARPDPAAVRVVFDEIELRPLVDHSIAVLSRSSMTPSQKLLALSFLQRSCYESSLLEAAPDGVTIVHDELILHRAFSLLLHAADLVADTIRYFELAPIPDAAVVFVADPDVIYARVQGRSTMVNCYAGLDEPGLRRAISKGLDISDIAAAVLTRRGVRVETVDSTGDSEAVARELNAHLRVFEDGGGQ